MNLRLCICQRVFVTVEAKMFVVIVKKNTFHETSESRSQGDRKQDPDDSTGNSDELTRRGFS